MAERAKHNLYFNASNINMKTRIYTPPPKTGQFAVELKNILYDLPRAIQLSKQIFIRETATQYRQSFLGIIWGLITPVFSAFVWILLQSSGAIRISDTGMPYPFYVAAGTLLWASFSESVFGPTQMLRQNKQVLGKVNFPKEALILASFYRVLLNSLLRISIIIALSLYFGIFSISNIIGAPFFIFVLILSGFLFGILMAPIGMLAHDVGRALPLVLQALMYGSPVIYAMPKFGFLAFIFKINPLNYIIVNARNSFVSVGSTEYSSSLIILGILLPFLIFVLVFFRKSMGIIIEKGN